MSDKTKIEWTDATWNPIRARRRDGTGNVGWHCEHASPGCVNCYAESLNAGGWPPNVGTGLLYKPGHLEDVEVYLDEEVLLQPLRWKKPRMIFPCSMTDLFGRFVTDEMLDRIFAVMALAPQHTFQVLTKRSARMRAYVTALLAKQRSIFSNAGQSPIGYRTTELMAAFSQVADPDDGQTYDWKPLPNVWLGVSVEDQTRADERIPDLLATPAAVRWLSCEPLLGPINLEPWLAPDKFCQGCDDGEGYGNRCTSSDIPRAEQCPWRRAVQNVVEHGPYSKDGEPSAITCDVVTLDWIVAGGESGPKARPMHPDWARSLRDQCALAGVPFHFKQWGEWQLALDRERDDPDWRADYSNTYVDHGKSRWLNLEGGRGFHGERFVVMRQVGKKRAGRLLDDVEHNGFPSMARSVT